MTTKIPVELSSTPSIVDNGDATAITITSAEKVGIGTTDPSQLLNVQSATFPVVEIANYSDSNPTDGAALDLIEKQPSFASATNTFGQTGVYGFRLKLNGSDNTLRIKSGSQTTVTDRVTLDRDTGNVGIGTTSPAAKLDVTSSSDEAVYLRSTHATTTNVFITNTNATTGNTASLVFAPANNITGATIKCEAKEDFSTTANRTADLFFLTRKDGTFSERMRITGAGAVCIGKTTDNTTDDGVFIRKHPTSGHGQVWCVGTGSSAYEGLYVYDRTNSEMEFYASYHGTVAYRALYNMSDERKKQNIQDITFGLDAIKELRPVSFDWKNNKGDNQLGFIAQEVETTSLKQLVGEWKDENIENCRSLNKEQMIPVLVKAIQEQQAIIEDLQTQINEVKNGN